MLEELKLTMSDGVELDVRISRTNSPVWLIASHGVGEHYRRHNFLLELFKNDFNIIQYDLRGHGKSSGRKGYVEKFSYFYSDLIEILEYAKTTLKVDKYILFGHSMGALITSGVLKNHLKEDFYPRMVFLSSPPVGTSGPLGYIVDRLPRPVFMFIAKFVYSIEVQGLVDLNYISHDPKVLEDYYLDELNSIKLHTRLLFCLVEASKKIFSTPINPKCKAVVAFGTGDRVVCPKAAKKYFSKKEKDFKVMVFEGAYHEMHNETPEFKDKYITFLKDELLSSL
jgi:acylglycerol lipase